MNGQVVPVSGTAGTGRMKERRMPRAEGGKGGDSHGGTMAHSLRELRRTFCASPLPPCSPLTPVVADIRYIYLRNTTRQPPLLFTFLSSPLPLPGPPSLFPRVHRVCVQTRRFAYVCRCVRGYRTGSSSLRGEPSWWRVAASFPPFGSRPRVFVRAEGESARRTQIGQLRFRREDTSFFCFFPRDSL